MPQLLRLGNYTLRLPNPELLHGASGVLMCPACRVATGS